MSGNILRITDVSKFSNIATNSHTEEYTKVPTRFTSLQDWPKRCNILCYKCTNPIIYLPLFIPLTISQDGIDRQGNILFCSPSCVFAEISNMKDRDLRMRYARELIRRITNIPINNQSFELSDDRSILNEYGGDLNRREYRDSILAKNKAYFDILLPLIELGR